MSNHSELSLWLDTVAAAFGANELIKITLTKPVTNTGDLKSVNIRPVLIKREMKLSFTHHHKTRDIVKNYSLVEARVLLAQLLNDVFTSGRLHSTTADMGVVRKGEDFSATNGKPSMQPADLTHNRTKNHLVSSSGQQYLHLLGLTDAQGHVLKTAQDKFRQINKYIEIVDGLVKDLPHQKLRIVDMGAGKGYLTFALYDHLVFTLKRDCEIVGVEFRPDLVMKCNEIANASNFSGLKFVEGTIAGYNCDGVDMVIALHACDTATDDAIAKAIHAKAQIIVVAPCCHKQIRRQMKAAGEPVLDQQVSGKHGDLEFLLRFGTYQERLSEMVTDGLRAQLMELKGYDTNLFEFISDAHTPKNVMIVGRKSSASRSNAATAKIAVGIAAAKQKFGIGLHHLEDLLEI